MWSYGPSEVKMLLQCNTSITFTLSNPLNKYLCSKKDFFGYNQFDYIEFFSRYITLDLNQNKKTKQKHVNTTYNNRMRVYTINIFVTDSPQPTT